MRTRTIPTAVALLAAGALFFWLAIPVVAQQKNPQPDVQADTPAFTPAQLVERTLHRRAVEAAIWGMPLVNFDAMRQAYFRDAGARIPVNRKGKHIVMSNGERLVTVPRHNPVKAFTMSGIV